MKQAVLRWHTRRKEAFFGSANVNQKPAVIDDSGFEECSVVKREEDSLIGIGETEIASLDDSAHATGDGEARHSLGRYSRLRWLD